MDTVVRFFAAKPSDPQVIDPASEALEWAWHVLFDVGHESTSASNAGATIRIMIRKIDQRIQRGTRDPFYLASEAIAAVMSSGFAFSHPADVGRPGSKSH